MAKEKTITELVIHSLVSDTCFTALAYGIACPATKSETDDLVVGDLAYIYTNKGLFLKGIKIGELDKNEDCISQIKVGRVRSGFKFMVSGKLDGFDDKEMLRQILDYVKSTYDKIERVYIIIRSLKDMVFTPKDRTFNLGNVQAIVKVNGKNHGDVHLLLEDYMDFVHSYGCKYLTLGQPADIIQPYIDFLYGETIIIDSNDCEGDEYRTYAIKKPMSVNIGQQNGNVGHMITTTMKQNKLIQLIKSAMKDNTQYYIGTILNNKINKKNIAFALLQMYGNKSMIYKIESSVLNIGMRTDSPIFRILRYPGMSLIDLENLKYIQKKIDKAENTRIDITGLLFDVRSKKVNLFGRFDKVFELEVDFKGKKRKVDLIYGRDIPSPPVLLDIWSKGPNMKVELVIEYLGEDKFYKLYTIVSNDNIKTVTYAPQGFTTLMD